MRRTLLTVLAMMLVAALQITPAAADAGSDNVELLANIPHTSSSGGGGSDLEFIDLEVPDGEDATRTITVGAMGVYSTGMHLYDVTDPENVQLLSVYECAITQGDVQLFTREDLPGRTFATYTSDTVGDYSPCYEDAEALGQYAASQGEVNGTFVVEITDPTNPTTISFVPHPQGSHNMTMHPSGMYLYNSNSDLITSAVPAVEITDLSDITNPVTGAELDLPTRPGLGTESHDITFNAEGTRAYSAALSQTVIINTEDPLNPSVVTSIVDPMINVEHQANPVTIDDPIYGEHDFLIIEDEFAGALGGDPCPSGGVHVYEIQDETRPIKVGYWNIGDARYPFAEGDIVGQVDAVSPRRCTAHVFEIHEEEALMTMAFYNGGVRVIDISGLVGVSVGGLGTPGMQEVGYYRTDDADTWAVKAPHVDRDGVFHMYGNDQNTGLDVYEVDLTGGAETHATGLDLWLAGEDLAEVPVAQLPSDYTPYCLLGSAPSAGGLVGSLEDGRLPGA